LTPRTTSGLETHQVLWQWNQQMIMAHYSQGAHMGLRKADDK